MIEAYRPDLWVHGHVRRHADHRVGLTRIVCNARGHVDERTGFVPRITTGADDFGEPDPN